MEIAKIIEKLATGDNPEVMLKYISDLRFDIRFNTLREIIYHLDLYMAEGNLEHAARLLKVAEKLEELLETDHKFRTDEEQKNVRTLKIIARKKKAKYYEARGEREKAIRHYLEIVKDLRLPEEENFLAEILMEIGIIEEQIGRKREAVLKFDKAAKIYKKNNDDFNYMASLFNCAHVFYDLNQYRKAEVYCRNVIQYYQEHKKVQSPIAHSYLEMANINELVKRDKHARAYYEKSLDAYRQLNEKVKMSDIMNRLGSYEMDEGHYASAATTYQEALDLKRTLDFQQGKGVYFFLSAEILRHSGNIETAKEHYNLAYHYFEESGQESKKLIVKHKLYLCGKSYGTAEKDMGTYVEKFKKAVPDTSKAQGIDRIDYKIISADGRNLPTMKEWEFHSSPKVNRKFLMFLLRNLSRVYLKLGREKDFMKFNQIKKDVEKVYYEKKDKI